MTTLEGMASRWRRDPCSFIEECLRDPETGLPFRLYPAQREFVRRAFTLTGPGKLRYPELLFGSPKKSGKTCTAALCAIYTAVVIGGPFAEVYVLANDFEQSASRVFQACARIIDASPLLKGSAKITNDKITFPATGSFIQACASDYAGFAGANPSLSIFDELWGYVHESSQRLFDEAVPSPARKVSGRLTVSYAGFEGESQLLERLHRRGMAGELAAPDLYAQPGMLMHWGHDYRGVPWVDDAWLSQMRDQLRPNQYLRMIENQWVTSESTFIEMDWWDACVDLAAHPLLVDRDLDVWVGVDASVKRDSTAIVACSWDEENKRVRLIWHRVFQPSPTAPLDFENTIERSLLELRERFHLLEVRFDPYQLVSVAQRLSSQGLPMVEFAQSVPNLTEASSNLYELIKGRNLLLYADDAMRLAISRAVAVETSRGWRIAKEKQSHKIDVIVALAQAALGAVVGGQNFPYLGVYNYYKHLAQGKSDPTVPTVDGEGSQYERFYREAKEQMEGVSDCSECGLRLGPAKVTTGRGVVHPECWRKMRSQGRE
jgi:phage terminase large subunit-like protein